MEVGFRKTARQYYGDPLFNNLLEAIFEKYQGQNGVKGNARFQVKTRAEAERIQDFFGNRIGRMIRPDSEIQVHLKIFAEELAFGYKLEIPELFEILYDKPLLTKIEQRQLKESAWVGVFDRVSERFSQAYGYSLYDGPFCNKIFNWFVRVRDGKAAGYKVLKRVMSKDEDSEKVLFNCVDALWHLFMGRDAMYHEKGISTPWIRLPILSEYVTKYPHAFDWKMAAGRLLWNALYDIDNQLIEIGEKRTNDNLIVPEFMKRRQVYRNFDIMDDDISSYSHIFAPHFIYGSSPRTLNLCEIESRLNWPKYSALYILENPAVFSFLVDETVHFFDVSGISFEQISAAFPVLVCTSGQSRNAANLFITKCIQVNPDCVIYYSGDFDLPGVQMQIAMEKLGEVRVWRMDSTTYLKHVDSRNVKLSTQDRKVLREGISGDLAKTMAKTGFKVFQEDATKELKEPFL